MPDVLQFFLRDHGPVLASRRRGREVAEHLHEIAREPFDLIIDFDQVEAATPPFLDELLDAIQSMINRRPEQARLVAAANLNEDIEETLGLVLDRRKQTLAHRQRDSVQLIKPAPHLLDTLREAQYLKRFTASELAEKLDVKPTTAHQRLQTLLLSGAIARDLEPGEQKRRGRIFRAATTEALPLREAPGEPRALQPA